MQIIDNIIILLLPVIAFFAGKRISDNYHQSIIDNLTYQLRLYGAEKGIGYVAPPVRRKYMPIGQDFMDRLKENGRATQSLRNSHT